MSDRITALLIPTRNRSDLARKAVQSVLDGKRTDIRVFVSDNSTDQDDSTKLKRFCEEDGSGFLFYIKPETPLRMSEHWEWAVGEIIKKVNPHRISVLTDRMVFKSGALDVLIEASNQYPDDVISYHHDVIDDYSEPIKTHLHQWSGRIYELSSTSLLKLTAQCKFHRALPRALNCMIPVKVLDMIQARYGDRFLSISPDSCFAYRSLERLDQVLFLDRSLLVHYGRKRSNGEAYFRGIPSRDHVDFIGNLGEKKMGWATPIPDFPTIANAILNEYCLVRRQTDSPKFPEVNMKEYLRKMESEILHKDSLYLRCRLWGKLLRHGHIPRTTPFFQKPHMPNGGREFANVEDALSFSQNEVGEQESRTSYLKQLQEIGGILGERSLASI